MLTGASGIPGHETEIRNLVRHYFESVGEVSHDRLGSLIYSKRGDTAEPKMMLVAPMDEVSFMVSHITAHGFIKFAPAGGWWDDVLLAQRVAIESAGGRIIGMIGAKPPYFLSDEERRKLVDKKDMYIDIDATSREEVERMGVRVPEKSGLGVDLNHEGIEENLRFPGLFEPTDEWNTPKLGFWKPDRRWAK